MKSFHVNGREYRVKDIPPWIHPYLQAYSNLSSKKLDSAEEAERVSEELKKVLAKLFTIVEPYPIDEDVSQVFMHILSMVGEVYTTTRFFQKGVVEAGRKPSVSDPPEAECAAGDE